MRVLVVDTSHWEGDIDWKIGYSFLAGAYYKATDGEDYIDSRYRSTRDQCDEVGLPHAPYHWWQEKQNPEVQAAHFAEHTTGGSYRRWIVDVEPQSTFPGIVDKLERHLRKIEELVGVRPTIYTSANYWNNYIKPVPTWAKNYEFIIAQYAYRRDPILPINVLPQNLRMWQWTDHFWFPGCNTEADGNWFYGDLTDCRNWFGNYHPYNEQPVEPPVPSSKTEMLVTSNTLRIRQSPNTYSPVLGTLHRGDSVEILDLGGADAWVKHSRGYSAYRTAGVKYMKPKE